MSPGFLHAKQHCDHHCLSEKAPPEAKVDVLKKECIIRPLLEKMLNFKIYQGFFCVCMCVCVFVLVWFFGLVWVGFFCFALLVLIFVIYLFFLNKLLVKIRIFQTILMVLFVCLFF